MVETPGGLFVTTHPRLFCSRPFRTLHVSGFKKPKGDAYLCCPSWMPTVTGNLQDDTVDQVWNGPEAQALRRSVLDGSFSHCIRDRCPYLQTISGPVSRVEDVTDPELRAAIEGQLAVLPYGPRELNCSYDNSCNLSCPTCRTRKIIERREEEQILRIQARLEDEALPDTEFLYITGSGDAFASPSFNRWLRTMDVSRTPRLETIHLHTNAQLWTPEMWAKIPPPTRRLIRSAEISIDAATASTYAINRRGGTFDTLLRNLAFVRDLRTERALVFLKISFVVQANNFREMPDFVQLGLEHAVDVVYFGKLVNWGTFGQQAFAERAVHLPDHPEHADLLDVLQHPLLHHPRVTLGNLVELQPRAERPRVQLPVLGGGEHAGVAAATRE